MPIKATITPNTNGTDFWTAGSADIFLTFETADEILLIIPVPWLIPTKSFADVASAIFFS